MSRIDEALRRKGDRGVERGSSGAQSPFVSAWDQEPGPRPVEALRPVPSAQPPAAVTGDIITVLREPQHSDSVRTLTAQWRERLATAPDADQILVEQFRRLAGTLHQAQATSGIRVIMLTSACPDDGKTLTAVNLALVLSESYRRRVLLIDADLRRPSLGGSTGLSAAPGLTDALAAKADQKLSIIPLTPTLMLLPAGRPDPDPTGGLTSLRMRQILEEAAGLFDWVILDAPPMGPLADAQLLAQMVDGAVFVIRAGQTQHDLVQKAIDSIGRERILGVVLNGVANMSAEPYQYYMADKDR